MSEQRRSRITVAIAIALHVGAFVLLADVHQPARHVEPALATTEIDLEPSAILPSGPVVEPPLVPAEEHPVGSASGARPSEATPLSHDPASGSETGLERESGPSGGAPIALFMTPGPTNLGIAGAGGTGSTANAGVNPFLANTYDLAPAAPTATGAREQSADAAKRRVEEAIRRPMRERDQALGLGPDGPALRALRDATYASLAPTKGRAIFLAIVDSAGSVVDVKLVSSTGNDQGWEDARAKAKKALVGQKLALRGAQGAEIKIEVSSDVLLASGNRPENFPIQPGGGEKGHISTSPNVPSGGTSDVVQSWTVATFDLSDIGAKPRRIVHAHVVETKLF